MTRPAPAYAGAALYRGPELRPGDAATAAADAYAYGVIAWELCSPAAVAELKHRASMVGNGWCRLNAHTVVFPEGTPLNLELLALACLSPDPAERPALQDAAEVLQSVAASLGLEAR